MNYVNFTILIVCTMLTASCTKSSMYLTNNSLIGSSLGLEEKDGWVLLDSPSSIWSLGTMVEKQKNGTIEDIGNISDTDCLDKKYIITESGEIPATAYTHTLDYDFSLSATIGLKSKEIIKAGLKLGNDAPNPTHKIVMNLDKVAIHRWSKLRIEKFLREHWNDLSQYCKGVFTDRTRYFFDKIYQVEKGSFIVINNEGSKVDLSTPQFQAIANASLNAGLKVANDGTWKVTENSKPITIAVRAANFDKVLQEIGVPIATVRSEHSFVKVMETAGASLPY